MKDTPIQKAIAEIEAEMKKWESQSPSPVRGALLRSRQILQSLLPYEMECIEGAWNDGEAVGLNHCLETAHDYFTQTFKQ